MSTEVILPKLNFSMAEGAVAEWLIADGAAVTAGQMLYVLESDKATQEIEAPAAGTLRIKVPAGEQHPCGTVLGVIE
jgi:pyruvate/2-oxoglutarate dehydrogenase complex dihydrolipoamide acyltransferase (E2) component